MQRGPAAGPVARNPLQPTAASPKRQLLLVEDDCSTYAALRVILARHGWEVRVATTVAEARTLLNSDRPWMVLDLMLPDGDGTALLREVRARNLQIRVLVITAVSDPERLSDVLALQPEALLRKPLDLDDLLGRLRA